MTTGSKDDDLETPQELIKHLRREAFDVKHCFTQYSFQGLALVTAILGVALKFYETDEYVGLVGVPLTLLLLTIASIGTHKYATANRLLGYELHMERTQRYPQAGCPGWTPEMRSLGWEEALRAWRIFQATVFQYLYVTGHMRRAPQARWRKRVDRQIRRIVYFWQVDRLKQELEDSKGQLVIVPSERWFETKSHLQAGVAYHAGGYLQTMLNVIYVAAFICLALALHVGYRILLDTKIPVETRATRGILVLVLVGLFSFWAFTRFLHCYYRRKLLEEGFLSINSCAVLWQAIACAHFKTLSILRDPTGTFLSYKDYSKTLGESAINFCDHIFDLYSWYDRNTPTRQTGAA